LAGAGPPAGEADSLDAVTIQRAGSTGRITLRGTIHDYTGTRLEFFPGAGGGMQTFAAGEVVAVTTPQTEPHRRGAAELQAGRIAAATTAFEQALAEEKRTWVRREILAGLVRCALCRADYASAGARFVALLQSDNDTFHFALIPLAWSPPPSDAGLSAQARAWLSHPLEAVQLIGASLLLDDERDGAAAEKELVRLGSSTDHRVLHLARAQLWRKSLRSPNLSREEIERWQARIDDMPERLRGGPLFLVGQGYLLRRENHRAAAALLWLPLVFDHDALLAGRACVDAAAALEAVGRRPEAAQLYDEAARRFKGTAAAEEAAAALEALRRSSKSP